MRKSDPLRFMSGNYLDRTSDACYVEIGDATVYFSHQKAIALIAGGCLYRVNGLDSGIIYKRVRSALLRQKPIKVQEMSRADLNTLIEAAIMNMASRLVEEKLGLTTADNQSPIS